MPDRDGPEFVHAWYRGDDALPYENRMLQARKIQAGIFLACPKDYEVFTWKLHWANWSAPQPCRSFQCPSVTR